MPANCAFLYNNSFLKPNVTIQIAVLSNATPQNSKIFSLLSRKIKSRKLEIWRSCNQRIFCILYSTETTNFTGTCHMFFSIVKISFQHGLNKMGAAWWEALICQHGLCGLWTTSTAPAVCWHEPAVGRSTHYGCFPSSPAESLFGKNEEAFTKPTNKTTASEK